MPTIPLMVGHVQAIEHSHTRRSGERWMQREVSCLALELRWAISIAMGWHAPGAHIPQLDSTKVTRMGIPYLKPCSSPLSSTSRTAGNSAKSVGRYRPGPSVSSMSCRNASTVSCRPYLSFECVQVQASTRSVIKPHDAHMLKDK